MTFKMAKILIEEILFILNAIILPEKVMSHTYLTTDELAARIRYDARTIRNQLVDSCLLEGRHYIRPFGRRKLLFIWEAIEVDLMAQGGDSIAMPVVM